MAGILNNLCSLAASISFHFVTVSPHQGMGWVWGTHYPVSTIPLPSFDKCWQGTFPVSKIAHDLGNESTR